MWTAGLLLIVFPGSVLAQVAGPLPQSAPTSTVTPPATAPVKDAKLPRTSDRRKAVKLYLAASKLFVDEKFEEAIRGYQQAATLDPTNANYPLAADVARSHAVTALLQAAAKARLRGEASAARAALARALELDPNNMQVIEHLHELGDDALVGQPTPLYEQAASTIGEAVKLAPTAGAHSFHLHTDQRQAIQQVFKAYGLQATVDDSVHPAQIRLDVDDATFEQAMRTLGMLTHSFYVPVDAHRVVVARDTPEIRQQFVRQELETVYLPGLTTTEMTDVGNLAKNVFEAQQATVEATAGTLTLRAPGSTLNAFNNTLHELLAGRDQVMLEARMIQLAHTNSRSTGAQLPQSMGLYNIYSEEQSILNANATTVAEIISSGLASASEPLVILGILIASGAVSSTLFSNGIATFGGGITLTGLSPGSVTMNLNLNSSESRELDQMQLRLGDGETGTMRVGMRYPIQTSSYSDMASSSSSIAGLTTAGTSSALSSQVSSLTGSSSTVPMVEYQDLGMTLKATPKVMRSSDVALTIDMKLDALSGESINGLPVLNNRAYSGVVTLKQGEAVVVVSELNKKESRAISGTPGLSEVPGLNDLTGKDISTDYSTLLIVITPHVIRGSQLAGHSPMMRVERSTTVR
jgi:general secretion pathway protein D